MDDKTNEYMADTSAIIPQIRRSDETYVPPCELRPNSLPSLLLKFMGERDISTEHVFTMARVDRSTGYKIMNGKRRPSRNLFIRVALVLNLDPIKTNELLRASQLATLTPKNERDAVVIYGLLHQMSIDDVQELLNEKGTESLD